MAGKQLYYEDVKAGAEIPQVFKRLTLPIMMRWCAAAELFRRDHWDRYYAKNNDKLPDAVLSSGFKQAVLYQLLQDWVGDGGWVWKMTHQDRVMIHPGDDLTGWGAVTDKRVKNGLGYVELEIGLKKPDGVNGVIGWATVVLPLKGGRAVPYPFQPESAD